MKNKQFFILILFLVIGFASISATLIINGNTKVAANLDDFNVIFIEGFLDGETSENVVISGDKKTLTFSTNKLTNINDTARIDYKVKNVSTQYDGDVTINCTNEANDYVSVSSSFDGQNLPLTELVNMQAQEVKSGYINAELIKATTEDQEVKITCKIEVNATSRTNYAYSLSFDSNGGTNVEDKVVEYNSNYGELSIPEKEGYIFVGWFNEEDVLVDENTVLDTKGNKTLTAKWAEETYPVTIVKDYPEKSETSEINIPYGESVDTLVTIDEKYFIDNIECTNGYTIDNYNKDEVIYGNRTISINNNHIPKSSTCTIKLLQGIFPYTYTGSEQIFNAPYDGNYKVELWGSAGGRYVEIPSGLGGYTSGDIYLNNNKKIFVYVGSQGVIGTVTRGGGGYNGGGDAQVCKECYPNRYAGGGATDVRLVGGIWNSFNSLKSRIMVAGAGGGEANGQSYTALPYMSAGGLSGYSGGAYSAGGGASQVAGGENYNSVHFGISQKGSFGYGGYANGHASGGGGGYYGGGGGARDIEYDGNGGGGSSFISGHNGCDAIAESSTQSNIIHTGQPNHYSGLIFTNTVMIDGAGYKWTNVKGEQTGMPTHDGKSTMTGNTGNGYAKITYLG